MFWRSRTIKSLRLKPGSRVGIVGGGPAGSFFALYLLRFAQKVKLPLEVDIYELKSFGDAGPKGCNRCAGVLSFSLLRNLKELQLELPDSIIQSCIATYRIHSPFGTMDIHNPEPEGVILGVFRGGGPLRMPLGQQVSFDGYLLEQARLKGAQVIHQRVDRIIINPNPAIVIGDTLKYYDLVVLACGVNTQTMVLPNSYVPPETETMAQEELYVGPGTVEKSINQVADVFLFPHSPLIFGTLVPKGQFMGVTLLGRDRAKPNMDDFLAHDLVEGVLPGSYQRSCSCRPKIAISPAKNPYDDGFVAIGDACVARLYKDGIGSALVTAREAAHTAIFRGISKEDFYENYMPLCNTIARDNKYGRILFAIHDRLKNSASFFTAHSKLATVEWSQDAPQYPFNKVIWGMLTGGYPYGNIVRIALSPKFLFRLSWAMFHEKLKRLRSRIAEKEKLSQIKVLILGGGFGGVYTALHLESMLRGVEITLVNNENFFLFTPFLHEVATGAIETRHIAYPIRRLRGRRKFNFRQGEIQSIDLENKRVVTNQGSLSYDYLVLALGSTTDTATLPASEENVFSLKSLHDGMVLRNHIIRMFEQADSEPNSECQSRLLTFVVAGGGYAGVQLITELQFFVRNSLLKNYRRVDPVLVRTILVEDEERVLTGMGQRLGDFALSFMKKQGIEVMLRSRITKVWQDSIEVNNNTVVPTATVIWVTGIKANPLIVQLPVRKDGWGRVRVNTYLQVPTYPNVYALGDNAHFTDPKSGQALPPRAHFAVRQAKIIAHNIKANIKLKPLKPFRPGFLPQLVSLGPQAAIANLYGLRLYGLLARIIWLASYLMVMKGYYNRIRVALDWFLCLIFGRDITLLKIKKQVLYDL